MYIQSIIDELSTKILMCKNFTYQLYFTNKDMFHVDILVGYLINNIFYYCIVSRETLQLLLYYF